MLTRDRVLPPPLLPAPTSTASAPSPPAVQKQLGHVVLIAVLAYGDTGANGLWTRAGAFVPIRAQKQLFQWIRQRVQATAASQCPDGCAEQQCHSYRASRQALHLTPHTCPLYFINNC